jgi:NAD(P)-dependent dehydrogenase (short-subunit alcohol dehydrogenase family)
MKTASPDILSLADKVAIVTGAGSGIGRSTCLSLARAGATVVASGRTMDKLRGVADEITGTGGNATAHQADTRLSDDVQSLIDETEQREGGIDIYFNNAGISPAGTIGETSQEQWDDCIATNLTSVYLAARHGLPALQRRGGGSFLITAGTLGLRPSREKAAYAAAKAGAINLMRSIAIDYGRDHIRANAVCPGLVATPLNSHLTAADLSEYYERHQPLPGEIGPEDIAATVVFLASDLGRFITGQCIVVDGGQQAGIS